ncbi:Uncharacterized conserved protein YdeI, YjbR/CyaY-like superfamily, DUF1801 family [Hyunsoonleella jejuensis]|uniref:Uncharacterized conserved protein YdeI, YjbR/CyaY-like superfamily, DUF1801 family n=1 Tax=Hyunsoonleella jejuensis TaxID=419940 RepID=A0A1H9DCQ1_9FLAO|nr:YdeI/OmpD-associated family protein [Hyunsoonleella jejuensis]SEQ11149.1 Uncharacterized conserved protein YdeI, YjbR/CyaY-like superfamily, DUF1801 family [Hyunsoonleella jejuensis]
MKKVSSVEEYIVENGHYSKALEYLRSIILSTKLEESIKWSLPVYTLHNKNVLGIGAFKNHFGIWFFNGVFLKDDLNILQNAQDGKTKAMRQMRFETKADIDKRIVLAYVKEAIENQKLGKEVKPNRSKKEVEIPKELEEAFKHNSDLKSSFKGLSNYKQREYCEYIATAKRETTKQKRLEKIIPLILNGAGLHDKYKNC